MGSCVLVVALQLEICVFFFQKKVQSQVIVAVTLFQCRYATHSVFDCVNQPMILEISFGGHLGIELFNCSPVASLRRLGSLILIMILLLQTVNLTIMSFLQALACSKSISSDPISMTFGNIWRSSMAVGRPLRD